jgi:hypothetical protein
MVVEIGQYDIEFIPRWVIKSQALADFIVEWTDSGLRAIDELPDHLSHTKIPNFGM